VKLSKSNQRALDNRKAGLRERIKRTDSRERSRPIIGGGNIQFQVSDRVQAINCGGIGAVLLLARRLGLASAIDDTVAVLKRHLPYHESDHVLAVAINILCGGACSEDLELLRQNPTLLEALGAARLPDPTTVGDFVRRFAPADILDLMEAINTTRQRVWELQHARSGLGKSQHLFDEAVIDVDGTIAETLGACKEGMDLSYKRVWGYCALAVTLDNTGEVLYLVNRPGNSASHSGAPQWLERAVELVAPHSGSICLRGDTDFSLTGEFDGWNERGVGFVFGMDSTPGLRERAESAPAEWRELERLPKYEVATMRRRRRRRVKEAIVKERGYKNVILCSEHIREFWYQPGKCQRPYRVIALRKNLSVERGETVLFPEIRYFFYITNRTDLSAAEVVRFINGRGDQENLIEQMKNGVHAMNMPVGDLNGNWAYMVMASLAWNLKAWCGLLMPDPQVGTMVLKLEFRRFLQWFIMMPCQIIRSGRALVYRMLSCPHWLSDWLALGQSLSASP
jgi:hypothetical protein